MATVENDRTPTRVNVAADGGRVTFLRGGALWVYDVGGTERAVTDGSGPGITTYATDALARAAVFVRAGRLEWADLATGQIVPVATAGPPSDARLDPTGARIGYLTGGALHVAGGGAGGALHVAGAAGAGGALLAGEPDPAYGGHPGVTWGHPELAARHFGRDRGWWWAPDGRSVLAARVDHARPRPEVSLHLLELDGGWVDVHWDRETYPYLVSVCWCDHGDPLIAVLRRPQQHGLVLAVDARTGETQVHAELADPRWVEPVPGTPCHLADGRVLVGGELAHDGYDARCLFADGTLLTPPSLYVRRVVGRLPGTTEIVVEGSAGEPSEQHLFRVSTSVGAAGIDARRITTDPGWHRAVIGGNTLVTGTESLEQPGVRWAVYRGDDHVADLAPPAGRRAGAEAPRPHLARVTDRRLPAGVLYPRGHVTGRRLPVLVTAAGLDQGVRAVRADWQARQEWADAGFVVVTIDHRGTPGVAPSFEKVVHRRLVDLALADLADALAALTGKHPDLDLDRVGIWGSGLGGWLAAMATLRRPELFRCAIAEAPLLDWADAGGQPDTGGQPDASSQPAAGGHPDAAFAERYLGLPDDGTEVYQRHCLRTALAEAATPDPAAAGPRLLLVPDAGDPVPPAGPYPMLPPGAGPGRHRAAELDFLRQHLRPG